MEHRDNCCTCHYNNGVKCSNGMASAKICLGGGQMYTEWKKQESTNYDCASCASSPFHSGGMCAVHKHCIRGAARLHWKPIVKPGVRGHKARVLILDDLAPPTVPDASDFVYKDDSGQIDMSLLEMIPNALRAFCELSQFGEKKYKRGSFIDVPNARRRYTAAMWRHYFKEGINSVPENDTVGKGSGMAHDIHTMWNSIIRVECRLRGLPLGKEDPTD